MKKAILLSFGLFLFLTAGLANGQTDQKSTTTKVVCHASMFNRINMLSKLYMQKHPNVKIEIIKVPLVQDSLKSLSDNTVDVVMASRVLMDEECEALAKKGIQVYERLIGYGGLVLITHPANTVHDLSLSQVKDVFSGQKTNWKDFGGPDQPITVVKTGETFPGTSIFLEKEFMGGQSFRKDATLVSDFREAMSAVSKTEGAISFVRVRDAFELPAPADVQFKVLKIRKNPAIVPVMPSRENVANGFYALKRPYYLYHRENVKCDVAGYIDFVLDKGWGSEQ